MIQLLFVPIVVIVSVLMAAILHKTWDRKYGVEYMGSVASAGGAGFTISIILVSLFTMGAHILAPEIRTSHTVALWQIDSGEWFYQQGDKYQYYYEAQDGIRLGEIDPYYDTVEVIRTDDVKPRLYWDSCKSGWEQFVIDVEDDSCGSYKFYIPLTEPAK